MDAMDLLLAFQDRNMMAIRRAAVARKNESIGKWIESLPGNS